MNLKRYEKKLMDSLERERENQGELRDAKVVKINGGIALDLDGVIFGANTSVACRAGIETDETAKMMFRMLRGKKIAVERCKKTVKDFDKSVNEFNFYCAKVSKQVEEELPADTKFVDILGERCIVVYGNETYIDLVTEENLKDWGKNIDEIINDVSDKLDYDKMFRVNGRSIMALTPSEVMENAKAMVAIREDDVEKICAGYRTNRFMKFSSNGITVVCDANNETMVRGFTDILRKASDRGVNVVTVNSDCTYESITREEFLERL